jgi:hypothetical protein
MGSKTGLGGHARPVCLILRVALLHYHAIIETMTSNNVWLK